MELTARMLERLKDLYMIVFTLRPVSTSPLCPVRNEKSRWHAYEELPKSVGGHNLRKRGTVDQLVSKKEEYT